MNTWLAANAILIQGTLLNYLIALSLQIPMRFGVFSFAGIASFGIGAYTSGILLTRFDWTTIPAVIAGMVLAGLVSWGMSLIVHRLTGLYLAMATIALTMIVGVIASNGGQFTGGSQGLFAVFGDLTVVHLIIAAVVVTVIIAWSEAGRLGRRVDAVREDPELAGSLGINVGRYRIIAFVAGGLIGSLAGSFEVILRTTIAPVNLGFPLVVTALSILVLGGRASWMGIALGAILVTWLPHLLLDLSAWHEVIYSVMVVLLAMFVPGGLFGIVKGLIRKATAGRRTAVVSDPAVAGRTSNG